MDVSNRALAVGKVVQGKLQNLSRLVGKLYKHPISGAGGSAATGPQPFDLVLTAQAEPSTNFDLTLVPGVVNHMMPSNMFTPIVYDPTTSIMVWLEVTTDGRTITAVAIDSSTSVPAQGIEITEGTLPTTFNLMLGAIVNGTITQLNNGNCTVIPSSPFYADRSPPVAGLAPTIKWWTWTPTFA